jgi:hypothetical protein
MKTPRFEGLEIRDWRLEIRDWELEITGNLFTANFQVLSGRRGRYYLPVLLPLSFYTLIAYDDTSKIPPVG